MMARTAITGIKSLLASSSYSPEPTEKLLPAQDQGFMPSSNKNMVMTTKSPGTGSTCSSTKHIQSRKKVKAHADISSNALSVINWIQNPDILEMKENPDRESSLQSLILLQKAMLEKQWTLSFQHATVVTKDSNEEYCREIGVIRSSVCARTRRMNAKKRFLNQVDSAAHTSRRKHLHSFVDPELLQIQPKTYVKGIKYLQLLSHAEVVYLSKKIRTGLSLENHKSRLKKRLRYEPSDKQVAASLSISHAELFLKQIECSLARNKLAMCNIGLVMSVAQKYSNMGTEMSDLVQGGLIGLLRGIEKFDSSKGFKISTYVYWWIRQGVSKALVENSKMLRLPRHIHERLSSIRNAKIRLEENGIAPSLDRIAESLHVSKASTECNRVETQTNIKIFSLDKEAFPSMSGLLGDSLHNYIADRNLENQPWHAVDEWSLKNEVKDLMDKTLSLREEIIYLYYGLKEERHTWEDVGKMIGL